MPWASLYYTETNEKRRIKKIVTKRLLVKATMPKRVQAIS